MTSSLRAAISELGGHLAAPAGALRVSAAGGVRLRGEFLPRKIPEKGERLVPLPRG